MPSQGVQPLNSSPITTLSSFTATAAAGVPRPGPYGGPKSGYWPANPAFAGAPPYFSTAYTIGSPTVTGVPNSPIYVVPGAVSNISTAYVTAPGAAVPINLGSQ